MTVFYATLASTFIMGVYSRMVEEKDKRLGVFFAFFAMVIIVLVSGLRSNIGDTETYMYSYEQLSTFSGFAEDMKDKGFILFQLILYNINKDPQFLVFVTSVITQVCVMYGLYKYRSYYELEIYMYITCGIFLVTMNGIRQAMVGAMLFASTKLIIKGKFIPYAIIAIILSTMHSSAIIMIPIYFIARQKAWSRNTMIIIIVSIIGFVFFYELMPHVFDMIGDSSYAEYEETMMQGGGGSSLMRVIVNAVPVVLAYINRKKIEELWPESNIFVNMAIINLIFITFALYNWIFARFQLYFQFYNIVLLPFIIKNCFDRKQDRDLVYYLFILCYFGFFYYEQVIGKVGLGYRSKYFSL